MHNHAPTAVLEMAFTAARTFNKFAATEVSDTVIHQLYDLAKWGPTSMNCQPARFVFVRSAESKARLAPCLAEGNRAKTLAAPLTVIVAADSRFYDHLPEQFPAMDAKPMFAGNAELAGTTAFRNSSLQGAYLIVAARLLGLDCGPMSGFNNAAVDAEFFADGHFKSNFLVNMGYGDASGNYPRGPRLDFEVAAQVL